MSASCYGRVLGGFKLGWTSSAAANMPACRVCAERQPCPDVALVRMAGNFQILDAPQQTECMADG